MVKKIKKYLKFVVCCALILSLIAPSYAALSASDGSAFVTKAEFDSALADFNARLTTFEAGINSKIDSQVTSYLDRNGIWNGQQQDFDIIEKYKSVGKWVPQHDGTSWSTTGGTWSWFEQWQFATEDLQERNNKKILLWKNGEKVHDSWYEGPIANHRLSYTRIFFMDDAFTAKKSGLCFYQIALSTGGPTYWWTPDGCKIFNQNIADYNEDYDIYFNLVANKQSPALFTFWYPTSEKVREFGSRDESKLYRAKTVYASWEYMPQWALGMTNVSWGNFIALAGNFFVEKGVSYGCGFRPLYCWTCSDYPWAIDDQYKCWDTGDAAKIIFGPKTEHYARFLPKLAIY